MSTATSLISGLLAGDENFGKVLGGYIGTAVDGLSGGGGAVRLIEFNFENINYNFIKNRFLMVSSLVSCSELFSLN